MCGLDRISDFCFGGRLAVEQGMRVLVAGGGTGTATVTLAEQLRDTPSEVTYLDLSPASLAIAQRRCEIRGLNNVQWRQGSLLDLRPADVGTFDYIDCTGVLHHLEHPGLGLRTLRRLLKPDGAMGLLVYGSQARAKIYQIQAELQNLTHGLTRPQKIAVARNFLRSHPYLADPDLYRRAQLHDSEFYDTFLHEQDKHPFSVQMIYEWLGSAGLHLTRFVDPRQGSQFAYDPRAYVSKREYREMAADLSPAEQQSVAERLSGKIYLHTFYATQRPDTMARADDPEMIPSFAFGIGEDARRDITELFIARRKREVRLASVPNGRDAVLHVGRSVSALFRYLDGNRTIGEIASAAAKERRMGKSAWTRTCSGILAMLRDAGWVTLRHQSLPAFKTAESIQRAQLQRQGIPDAEVIVEDVVAENVRAALG